jgi:hypothetical protein
MADDLLGTVRRKPGGTTLAVLWPADPHPHRWMTTDHWGSSGYESDATVADWPVVGAVPYSPAAGFPIPKPEQQVGD